MSQPLTAVLIGAGSRGHTYGAYALKYPEEVRFVAVAEPNDVRRTRFARAHGIAPARQFRSWEDLLSQGKVADAAVVCTPACLHTVPTISALESGYDVLLEKPMAITSGDCVALVQAAERTGRLLQVCHVLRYAPFFSTLHDVVVSGRLGDIVAVEHRVALPYWGMAHLYVRSSWGRSEVDGPMILTKCCHDLDILYWNLGLCAQLGSSGALVHFRAENAPPGAPERCTDGCPVASTCPWYAPRIYVDLEPLLHIARRSDSLFLRLVGTLPLGSSWFDGVTDRLLPPAVRAIFDDPTREGRLQALRTGPFGRCVYRCASDMVDCQTVDMAYESGVSATLSFTGHSYDQSRAVRYDGARATLIGRFAIGEKDTIEIHDHVTGRIERIVPTPRGSDHHGGGDMGVVASFVRAVRGLSDPATGARESLESHLVAFAAEEARSNECRVDMVTFRHRAERA